MLYSSLFSTSKELEVLKRLPMPLTSTKTINITKNNQKKKKKPKQEEDKKNPLKYYFWYLIIAQTT